MHEQGLFTKGKDHYSRALYDIELILLLNKTSYPNKEVRKKLASVFASISLMRTYVRKHYEY
jgi:hypothetical protein